MLTLWPRAGPLPPRPGSRELRGGSEAPSPECAPGGQDAEVQRVSQPHAAGSSRAPPRGGLSVAVGWSSRGEKLPVHQPGFNPRARAGSVGGGHGPVSGCPLLGPEVGTRLDFIFQAVETQHCFQ